MIKIDGKLRLKENFLNFREDIYKKLQLTLYLMARKSKLLHQGKDVPYATLFQHHTRSSISHIFKKKKKTK